MKKIPAILYLVLVTSFTYNSYSQTDTAYHKMNPEFFFRQAVQNDFVPPEDTIKLFLEDTEYYIKKDIGLLMHEILNNEGYLKYFKSTTGSEFELRDSLPDGFYCLYKLKKKQSKKVKDKSSYIVASGEFKNGMKQGAFRFREIPEGRLTFTATKVIYFKDDIVNGFVIEFINDNILFLGEYRDGIKHGFFYYNNSYKPIIKLYENGEVVKSSVFY